MAANALDQTAAWRLILQAVNRQNTTTSSSDYDNADSAARELLTIFLPLCRHLPDGTRSLVVGQMGQSLDGRIATVTGASKYINGEGGLRHLHRLRAICDAVVVGAGTASEDNPRLTVRLAEGPNPVRVVIDRQKRVPGSHAVFTDEQSPTLRLTAGTYEPGPKLLPRNGVLDVPCLGNDQQTQPKVILDVLADFGLRRVFIEGGGLTVSAFLNAGLLDHLHVMVAPMIIGSGRPAFSLPEIDRLDGALRPSAAMVDLGSDMLFALNFSHGQAD
ncbi:RibD family protein [Marinobacter sp. CHS3-4]|uniref:RibD family protein n=1 Tax=Marinobacter sp. CHS3-4 TaxID=3045174 RepID=UPI0024B59FE1|nr:RibD family protein [Marinobacter sp. CHS3-4]MDI9245604.1 RibD family protein [Marinobacter sp. CHS3-4]